MRGSVHAIVVEKHQKSLHSLPIHDKLNQLLHTLFHVYGERGNYGRIEKEFCR